MTRPHLVATCLAIQIIVVQSACQDSIRPGQPDEDLGRVQDLVAAGWFHPDTIESGSEVVLVVELANPTDRAVRLEADCPIVDWEAIRDNGSVADSGQCLHVGPAFWLPGEDGAFSASMAPTEANLRLESEEAAALVHRMSPGLEPGDYTYRVGLKGDSGGWIVWHDARLTILPSDGA